MTEQTLGAALGNSMLCNRWFRKEDASNLHDLFYYGLRRAEAIARLAQQAVELADHRGNLDAISPDAVGTALEAVSLELKDLSSLTDLIYQRDGFQLDAPDTKAQVQELVDAARYIVRDLPLKASIRERQMVDVLEKALHHWEGEQEEQP